MLAVGYQQTLTARNMRAPAMGFLLQGWSRDRWGSLALPLDLTAAGMPGCDLLVRPETTMPFVSASSFRQWNVAIPSLAELQGLHLYSQVVFSDPAANAGGFGTTPGLAARIDPPPTPTAWVSQIQQWGITFVFQQPVEAGQFANGDWFVIGPALLSDTLPHVTSSNGRILHGAMVDPDPSSRLQGYDGQLYGDYGDHYRAQLNAALAASPNQPLLLRPGQRIIKVISDESVATVSNLQTASVLTCLGTVPPEGSFRPPYSGPDAAVTFHTGMLDWSRLRSVQAAAGRPSIAATVQQLERVWLDHTPSWIGRYMHPALNMPDYGRDLATLYGEAALIANCTGTVAERQQLVIHLVQIGIDYYGCLLGGCRWPGLGGHGTGRKLPILFAGAMLGRQDMLEVGHSHVSARQSDGSYTAWFGEDTQTFYVRETSPGIINFGHGNYTQSHLGLAEYGFSHTSNPAPDNVDWNADPYRVCCTANAWVGHVLVARMMGLVDRWNHPPLFAYTDRYMATETIGWHRSWSGWTAAMWDLHRSQF
jgi:hypothetical protein